jgi:hypothetical protein
MFRYSLFFIGFLCVVGCAESAPDDGSTETVFRGDAPRVGWAPKTLPEAVEATLSDSRYQPSEAARSLPAPARQPFDTIKAALVTLDREIVVMQGSAKTISDFGQNKYGLVMNQQVQNPMEVAKEFFKSYPDEFDVITMFTTFPDTGSKNSVAWYMGIRSGVQGVGIQPKNMGQWWGSGQNGRLNGFINMQFVGKYGSNLAKPTHPIHRVMAQEFGHQWGTFVQYKDPSGKASTALLGRDNSHWANTVNTHGSVMDGHEWEQANDTTFVLKAKNYRYSQLDQYIMGLRGPHEVADFYRIKNATYNGKSFNKGAPLPKGIAIKGQREDISIDQVIAVHGPRVPDYSSAPKNFRVAIVLVTRPEEDPSVVDAMVDKLETFRLAFEERAAAISDGRMKICTQVSAPCGNPVVGFAGATVTEHQGNGNGAIEPGETAAIHVTVRNDGPTEAPDVSVEIEAGASGIYTQVTSQIQLGSVPSNQSATTTKPLLITLSKQATCGDEAVIALKVITGNYAVSGVARFEIGVRTIVWDPLDNADGWVVNPYGDDSATTGAWEIAQPKGVDAFSFGINLVSQPSKDHSASDNQALVTGSGGGKLGDYDVDDGTTTVLSPIYDISNASDPVLTWYSWRFGYDFNTGNGVVPVTNDALTTEVSADGGQTWTLIDTDSSNTQSWVRKDIRLADFVPLTGEIRLRFTMSDDDEQSISEAMIDDIRIWEEEPQCGVLPPEPPAPTEPTKPTEPSEPSEPSGPSEPPEDTTAPTPAAKDDSGGCRAGGSGSSVPLMLCLALWCLAIVSRRKIDRSADSLQTARADKRSG